MNSKADSKMLKLHDEPVMLSKYGYPDYITSIHPTNDGCAWISDNESNTVVLIDNQCLIKRKVNHHGRITDICVEPGTNDLWFSSMKEKSIYNIPNSSEIPVKQFKIENEPFYLCVTLKGRIVVGSEYRVTMYTKDGDVLNKTTEEDSGVMSPGAISECPATGNIAIVNGEPVGSQTEDINNWRSHIIVFDKSLTVLFHYRGEGIPGDVAISPELYGPESIAYDSFGNLVVADFKRCTIELISGSGEFIKTLHTNEKGQGALGIQNDNVLWTEMESDDGEWEIRLLKYCS